MIKLDEVPSIKLKDEVLSFFTKILDYQRIWEFEIQKNGFIAKTIFYFNVENESKKIISRIPFYFVVLFQNNKFEKILFGYDFEGNLDPSLFFNFLDDCRFVSTHVVFVDKDSVEYKSYSNENLEQDFVEMFGSDVKKMLSAFREYNKEF